MDRLSSDIGNAMKFKLKPIILAFWALWFSLAVLTNIFEIFKHLQVLPMQWWFHSQNFTLIKLVLDHAHLSTKVAWFVFAAVLIGEAFCCATHIRAFITQRWEHILYAFTCSMSLWFAFVIAEEILIAYSFEAVHIRLLLLEGLSLLMLAHGRSDHALNH